MICKIGKLLHQIKFKTVAFTGNGFFCARLNLSVDKFEVVGQMIIAFATWG